ncbi:MAG: hypothetical protein LBF82_01990 [Lactobacillales bacterium]|jgi:hypothetical protein|nr:hypothetical protein [Lactobacillales bacterium]
MYSDKKMMKKVCILPFLYVLFIVIYSIYSIYRMIIGKYNFHRIFYKNNLFVIALSLSLEMLNIFNLKKKKIIEVIVIIIAAIDFTFLSVWTAYQLFIQKNGKVDYLFFFLSIVLLLIIFSVPLFNKLEHRKKDL